MMLGNHYIQNYFVCFVQVLLYRLNAPYWQIVSYFTVNICGHPTFWWFHRLWELPFQGRSQVTHILDSVAGEKACDLGSVTWPMQGAFGSELREEMATWEGTSLLLRLRWSCGGEATVAEALPPVLRVIGTEHQCGGVFLREAPTLWFSIISGCVASGFGTLALLASPELPNKYRGISFSV